MPSISDRQFAAFMEQPAYETQDSFLFNEKEMSKRKTAIGRDINVNLTEGGGND